MKQLILTLATGLYSEIGQLTYPYIKDYAHRTNSDFHVITDNLYPQTPLFEKVRIKNFLDDYDRVLYFDVDLIVRKDCPNLFDIIPANSFAAYDEGILVDDDELRSRRRLMTEMSEVTGAPFEIPSHRHYFNVGVMMVSKSHSGVFQEPAKMSTATMGEQSYINIMLEQEKPDLYFLPKCFNQMPFNREIDFLQTSYIIHQAGGHSFEERLDLVRQIVKEWGGHSQ